jgi:hypothetical protein
MERFVLIKNNLFHNNFLNIDDAQNYVTENFEAKLINNQLCDKNGDRKTLKEIFEDNAFELKPLRNIIEPYGIAESEMTNVHIEDGQLVVTLKDGTQKKIKY